MVKLSILIPTVETRRSLLSRLLWTIEQQITDEVEVIIYDGWIPVGDKMTEMRKRARGVYSMVVDDDDMLMSDAIPLILEATETGVDYIGFDVLHLVDGKFEGIVSSSIMGDKNWQKNPYYLHHKCPIRTSIGNLSPVGNHYRLDRDWAVAVGPSVQSETIILKALYVYDYRTTGTVGTTPSDQNADTQLDVGDYPYTKERFIWI